MQKEKKQVFSRPFNLVYEKNYPSMYLGPGIYKNYNFAKNSNPKSWLKFKNIDQIKKQRNKQIFTFKKYKKEDCRKNNKYLENIQLLTQSIKTTELEIDYKKKAKLINEDFSGTNNLSYSLNNIKIIDNIKIPLIIDKTVNDFDLKAKEGILKIYNKTKDVYKTQQLLSVGLLGLKKNRILVPTRWSITGTDDIISKKNIENIKYNKIINDFYFFYSKIYKNEFYIILIPEIWGFENIEQKNNSFCKDYEKYEGRKDYASNVTGGYYATRLEVTNYLVKRKKQARAIVFRNIDPSYESQGVWVVREAIKKTFLNKGKIFNNLKNLISYIDLNYNININRMISESKLIKDYRFQKKIFAYFKKE
jgi:hypothetical protein